MHIRLKNPELEGVKNILDIKIPPQLETTCEIGIDFFDDAVGGFGLTPSTVMLLSGTPGAGKTTLAVQICDAATSKGHLAVFQTGEEHLYQVRKVAKRLKLQHGFVPRQETAIDNVIANAAAAWREQPDKQLIMVYDSLQTLDDGSGSFNESAQLRCVEQISSFCKDTYAIAIIIGQVTKSGVFAGKNKVIHAIDVHAHFYVDNNHSSETYLERLFEVRKNRFGTNGRCYVVGMEETGVFEKGSFQRCLLGSTKK